MAQVLLWLFELGVLLLVSTLAFMLLCAKRRSFAGALRAAASIVIGGTLSGAVGLVVGIAAAVGTDADPVGAGLLATIVSLPVSLWLLDRIGRRPAGPGVTDGAALAGYPRVPEPTADSVVASAWIRAARLAPAHRHRLAAARQACAYVLHWAETHPFDMPAMECAVLIRKRLPELVEKTDTYHQLAGRAERRAALDGMVGDLERLGRMASTRVERARLELGESLAATRSHIASRTSEEAAF